MQGQGCILLIFKRLLHLKESFRTARELNQRE